MADLPLVRAASILHPHPRRVKIVHQEAEDRGDHEQFSVRDISESNFDLCERGPADVQPGELAEGGQLLLA